MMRDGNRVYGSFEEFEREELRRGEALGLSIDDMMDEMLVHELDFDLETGTRARAADAADDDDDDE
ncbi:MAG: hypothetical protein AABZ30_12570 [Myxococcota bacterium]